MRSKIRLNIIAGLWMLTLILVILRTNLAISVQSNSLALLQVKPIINRELPIAPALHPTGKISTNQELVGIAFLTHGNPRKALPYLEEAANERTLWRITDVFLGQALYEVGRIDEAITVWKNVGAGPWLILEGMVAQKELDFENALIKYQLSSRVDPSNPLAFQLAGDVNQYLGRWDQAEQAYRRAALIEKEPYKQAILIGQAALIITDWDAALSWYHRAALLQPDQSEPVSWQGYIWYWGYGDFLKGKSLLQHAVILDPKNITPYVLLIQMCTAEKDYICADEWFRLGNIVAPDNVDLLFEAARSYNQRSDFVKVIEFTDKITKTSPAHIQAWKLKGSALLDNQQPLQAEQVFRQALTIAPHDGELLIDLTRTLLSLEMPCEALENAEQASSLAPPTSTLQEDGQNLRSIARERCNLLDR